MLDNSLFLSCSQSESRLQCVTQSFSQHQCTFFYSLYIVTKSFLYLSSINKAKCISTKLSIHVHTFHVVVTIIWYKCNEIKINSISMTCYTWYAFHSILCSLPLAAVNTIGIVVWLWVWLSLPSTLFSFDSMTLRGGVGQWLGQRLVICGCLCELEPHWRLSLFPLGNLLYFHYSVLVGSREDFSAIYTSHNHNRYTLVAVSSQ